MRSAGTAQTAERRSTWGIISPEAERLNAARYNIHGGLPANGLLLSSEAYHTSWLAKAPRESIKPLKAYGFMNAYPLPDYS